MAFQCRRQEFELRPADEIVSLSLTADAAHDLRSIAEDLPTQRPAPRLIMRHHNFGASGRQGTLAVATPGSAAARSAWAELQGYVCASRSVRCSGRVVVLCTDPTEIGEGLWSEIDATAILVTSLGEASDEQPARHQIVANLGDPAALAEWEDTILTSAEAQLFIVSGVLERLVDPRPLLRVLRRLLKRNLESRLVVATLDRLRLGAMSDPIYTRLWSKEEFCCFLGSAGFEVLFNEYVGGDGSPVVVSEVRCSREYYDRFLLEADLPRASARLALLSTDDQSPHSANIERYLFELAQMEEAPVVLSAGQLSFHGIERQSLRAEDLVAWDNAWLAPESLLEAVLHVIFLYDSANCIEFQDHGGLFFRIPQAKRSGLLPPHVECRVVCHGNNFHVERMTRRFQPSDWNLTHLWEKIAIELADSLVFPTHHMRRLYCQDLGLRPLGTSLVRQLPYHPNVHNETLAGPATAADTVVFLGAQMGDNGWPEFCEAVATLLGPEGVPGQGVIRRVVAIGKRIDGPWPVIGVLDHLEPDIADLPRVLQGLAPRSVVVVAKALYGYPYPLMQTIDAGCSVLALAAGGVDELIPRAFHDRVIFRQGTAELADALTRLLALHPSVRAEQAEALRDAMCRQHEAALASWSELSVSLRVPRSAIALSARKSPVTVVVPVYNRPISEIEELIVGLNGQTLLPQEVIFVDDASDEDFATLYAGRIRASLRIPAQFIRHPRNKGLSGARNTGLHACSTEFVAMHDSDNVAANDFLYRGCLALMASPELDAITFELMAFFDGDDWTTHDPKREHYRPVGDGLVQSLTHINWFGDAMAVYRVATLRESGGWDESDRAMWEDLALYMKLAVAGRRIMNAPRPEVFYRIREHSMLRTGSEYDARQRMAHVLSGLRPFDAFCLQRVVLTHPKPPDRSSQELLLIAARQYLDGKPRLLRVVRSSRALARRALNVWSARSKLAAGRTLQ